MRFDDQPEFYSRFCLCLEEVGSSRTLRITRPVHGSQLSPKDRSLPDGRISRKQTFFFSLCWLLFGSKRSMNALYCVTAETLKLANTDQKDIK